MKKLILLLVFLVGFFSYSQSEKYRIMTSNMEIIHAIKIRYSENGKFLYAEDSSGELFKISVKDVISKRKEVDDGKYFEWSDGRLTDNVVVEIDSLSKQELFDLTMNWIKESYKNPDEVIKTTIDNSKIRFQGSGSFLKYQTWGGDMYVKNGTYTVTISFKDGKYKFEPNEVTTLDVYNNEITLSLDNTEWRYKSWGNNNVDNSRKYWSVSIEDQFNELNLTLYAYILLKKHDISSDDDW